MYKYNTANEFINVLGDPYNENFFTGANENLERELDTSGIVVLSNLISSEAIRALQEEAASLKEKSYRSRSVYNLYVLPEDKNLGPNEPRNRKFQTTKGCIADDQIPQDSILRKIYNSDLFREFICKLQKIENIFPYADTLSSININYYDPGDNLEWHFDNSDFAITILIKNCEMGGIYEYFPDMRYTENGKENYTLLEKILDGKVKPKSVKVAEGDLMIFRGNRSLHRVTKVEKGERILVTLNYNVKPGMPLSEESRITFFGRTV